MNRFGAFSIATVIAGSISSGVNAQDQPPPDEAPAVERPKFTVRRFSEDWFGFKDVPPQQLTDFWDPIKHVPLNDDGSIWASFGGSMRLRLENWHNFNFLPSTTGDDTFLLWQAMAHGDFHFGDNLRVFAQLKSALSTDRSLPGGKRTVDVDTFALHQGFVDVKFPVGENASITIRPGRQEYLYGKQRLVSPLQWSNTRRSWDGVTGILKWNKWQIDGWWSRFVRNRKYEYNKGDPQTVFYGVYATGPLREKDLGLDLYFIGLNTKDPQAFSGTTGPEDRYTLGSRLFGKFADTNLDFDLEAAYQFGRVGQGDVRAYMIGSQAGYRAAGLWSAPRLFVGFDMGSGDNSPGGDVETFNQIFPLGHAYLGYIDQIGRQNIIDFNLGVQCTPMEKLTAQVKGHFFWRHSTTDAVYNAGGGVVRAGVPPLAPGQTGLSFAGEVGQEIDFTLVYRFDRHTTASFGYGHFFPGTFIRETGPSNAIDFLYLQLHYTF